MMCTSEVRFTVLVIGTVCKVKMSESQHERKLKILKSAKRIVVKVGSGVLTGEKYTDVDEGVVSEIARQVAQLVKDGRRVAVVSSGSVVLGSKKLGLRRYGLSIPEKQASAAVGQGELTSLWTHCFADHGVKAAQMLLTHDDLANRRRFLNSRNTINKLFDFGVVPVINENDSVAVHELKFGDNDTLSARVTNLVGADLLAILSDVDGLYSADPRQNKSAYKIDFVEEVDDFVLSVAGDSSSRTGLGGMSSKVKAAAEAAKFGAGTMILPGIVPNSLLDAMTGIKAGTFFFPNSDRMSSKKHWIVFHLKSQGKVIVDDGAKTALLKGGKSLLATGVTCIEGDFESGEAVYLVGPDGVEFAKGLIKYHSHELNSIKGRKTSEIESILGYKPCDEVMHRDDMVFITTVTEPVGFELKSKSVKNDDN
ncbi:Glutamate 5-kinase / RNA-binding C-terminal domain PUA [hydrothermal vent metagenome]|uniref:Glutamate 5-kinase / RNA-binding C-terminal domain PUA n=1 Tax=hydrothermal vent metagenome TaxID=652676 RepID=A0A3B1C6H6_9ZZZZ